MKVTDKIKRIMCYIEEQVHEYEEDEHTKGVDRMWRDGYTRALKNVYTIILREFSIEIKVNAMEAEERYVLAAAREMFLFVERERLSKEKEEK